jgi:hypothetical protein
MTSSVRDFQLLRPRIWHYMNFSRAMVFLVCTCTIAPSLHGQGQWVPAVSAGAVLPVGDLRNSLNDGFHLGVSADKELSNSANRRLRVELSYSELGARGHAASRTRIVAATANMVFAGRAVGLQSYAIAGVGLYGLHRPAEPFGGAGASTSVPPGFNAGAGAQLTHSLRIEARYHIAFSNRELTQLIPISMGFQF